MAFRGLDEVSEERDRMVEVLRRWMEEQVDPTTVDDDFHAFAASSPSGSDADCWLSALDMLEEHSTTRAWASSNEAHAHGLALGFSNPTRHRYPLPQRARAAKVRQQAGSVERIR